MKRNPIRMETLKQYPKALRHARECARKLGYAIGLHGSRTYDLDLIAAPWADGCCTPKELASAIAISLGWYLHVSTTKKPHGRICFLIYGPNHAHIDLSVMPKGVTE